MEFFFRGLQIDLLTFGVWMFRVEAGRILFSFVFFVVELGGVWRWWG